MDDQQQTTPTEDSARPTVPAEQPAPVRYASPVDEPGFDMNLLISAAIALFVGFGLRISGDGSGSLFDWSNTIFTRGAQAVGIILLVLVALKFVGIRQAVWAEFAVAVIVTAGCLVIGVIWIMHSALLGYLVAIVGLIEAQSASMTWRRLRPRIAGN